MRLLGLGLTLGGVASKSDSGTGDMKRKLSTMSQSEYLGKSAVFLAETSLLQPCTLGPWGEVGGGSLVLAGVLLWGGDLSFRSSSSSIRKGL